MERTKRERAKFRAQFIPVEEMFTQAELMDLRNAFEAAAQPGESHVNMHSLKTLFASMGIFPSDEMLHELLNSCGKNTDDDIISFELFARSVALLLEENAEKGSTSSQNE
jgi:Ca2+-binding EF-hand superfamily protein